MWVEIHIRRMVLKRRRVILFVRMWVEIYILRRNGMWNMSSSSWGCELKCDRPHWDWDTAQTVILFVRMWVEILYGPFYQIASASSSSWGCELKCVHRYQAAHAFRHPLREDVSWNSKPTLSAAAAESHPLREDVSWNIKYPGRRTFQVQSSSSWGCELK